MVMRYFGGGIGHLKNAPPLQVPGFDPIDPSSEEMAVEDDGDDGTNEDLGAIVQQSSRDVVMNGGELVHLEVGEDDEDDEDDEDSDDDEAGDQTDEDEDGEGEDDYGYASP